MRIRQRQRLARPSTPHPALALALAVAVWSTMAFDVAASEPGWRPIASERLVKLPAAYLRRAIDRDFAESTLGTALDRNRERADLKAATLDDLARAQASAEGDLRLDLRQRMLGEKQAFIRIMGERQALERKRADARLRLLRSLIRRVDQTSRDDAGAAGRIRAEQSRARKRFESSLAKVDDALFRTGAASDSRYARDHARNVAAIEDLRRVIAAHPMSRGADPNLADMSKREYLAHMIMETEAMLAVLAQEEKVLGYMAKLVALDAMAFAEELEETADPVGPPTGTSGPVLSSAVRWFTRN